MGKEITSGPLLTASEIAAIDIVHPAIADMKPQVSAFVQNDFLLETPFSISLVVGGGVDDCHRRLIADLDIRSDELEIARDDEAIEKTSIVKARVLVVYQYKIV